jgi:hypothetical protein
MPRYLFKPHLGLVVTVRAVSSGVIADYHRKRRGEPVMSLREIVLENSDEVTQHCHVKTNVWWRVKRGENVRFRAKVISYERPTDRSVDWSLDGFTITDFEVLRGGRWEPVTVLPDPRKVISEIRADNDTHVPSPPPAVPPPPRLTIVERIQIGKSALDLFAGDADQLARVVDELPSLIEKAGGAAAIKEDALAVQAARG